MMIHFHTQKEKTKKNNLRLKKKNERKKYDGYTVFFGNYRFFEIALLLSPHVREFGFRNPENLGLWSPESWKLLLWNPESLAM